jgi:3-oxoacyl-[acyl-carrier-protein] synthase II
MTTSASAVRPLVITSAGVVSAAGLGLPALAEALTTGNLPDAPAPDPSPGDYPDILLRPVQDPDFAGLLGRKGLRHLDRTTKLGLVACGEALHANTADVTGDADTGVVMATSTGSVRSSAEFCRDTLVQERPYLVNAGHFPNTVMNCCAGQVAIRNHLRGVNATVAGGRLSSLFAFRYARNALGRGRVRRLLLGGVEELSPQTAWAWKHGGRLQPGTRIGEGAAVFTVAAQHEEWAAPADGPTASRAPATDAIPTAVSRGSADGTGPSVCADLLACEVAYYGAPAHRGRQVRGLTDVISRALHRSAVTPGEVSVVAPGAAHHIGLRHIEQRALAAALGAVPKRQVRVGDVLGELFSAHGAFQLAALLALWQAEPAAERRTGLVTSLGADGNLGCLVVRERD